MKKLAASIAFSIFAFIVTAQSPCLPEGITFTAQEQIDSFQLNYLGCTEIDGDVLISGNGISNLNGLAVLTSIFGNLVIYGNDSLISLTGLDNLNTIEGDLQIGSSAQGIGNWGNPALTSLTGLEGLISVGGNLRIYRNIALTNMLGLQNLTIVDGDLTIAGVSNLVNLTGLDGLTLIGGDLGIFDNESLVSLDGLSNLTNIGGNLKIGSFIGLPPNHAGNSSLISISGLEGLAGIDGALEIRCNHAITSLTGLDNLNSNSITDLSITANWSLSECHLLSICDYLASPNGTIDIQGNDTGCNSVEEVEEACESQGVEDINIMPFTIHPNPSDNGYITLTLDNPHNLQLSCFNNFGQQIHQQEITGSETIIDVSTWSPGIYLAVVVEDGKPVGRSKFVVR
jgi:hypothetical protein